MTIYIALLQGVNVGKHKRISMTDLKQMAIDVGGIGPATIANSGNVVFAYDGEQDTEDLRLSLEQAISDHVGQPVPTILRTDHEGRQIVANSPYSEEIDPKCLHVEFLNEATPHALDDLDFGKDHLTMTGREIYLHAPNKMSGITYDAKTLYKRLGNHHTSRNWNTVTKLAELAESMG